MTPGGRIVARAQRLAVAAVLTCGIGPSAWAQYSQPIFLEAARDPGRAEVPSTARSLALAGVRTTSGLADAALASPASLVLERGTDLVVAGGTLLYARDELTTTPAQVPPGDPTRRTSPRSAAAVGSIAVATRRRGWAAAGFIDGGARYRHGFETAQADLRFATVQGVGFFERGGGRGTAAVSAARLGGAFAVPFANGRLGVGAAGYAVRLDYEIAGETDVQTWSNTFTDPTFRHRSTTFESDRVDLVGWGPGVALSVVVKPAGFVTLSARWLLEPGLAASRELRARELTVTGQPGPPRPGIVQDVKFHLPDTYAVSGMASLRRTLLVTELARTNYDEVFEPASGPGAPAGCETLTTIFCPGWAFGAHRTADATSWRAGVEHSVPVGGAALRLRAGIAFEQGYTLALASGGDRTWLSFGAAIAWERFEIGVGAGGADHQRHLLTDFRMRLP